MIDIMLSVPTLYIFGIEYSIDPIHLIMNVHKADWKIKKWFYVPDIGRQ